jgi:hypothetical protein
LQPLIQRLPTLIGSWKNVYNSSLKCNGTWPTNFTSNISSVIAWIPCLILPQASMPSDSVRPAANHSFLLLHGHTLPTLIVFHVLLLSSFIFCCYASMSREATITFLFRTRLVWKCELKHDFLFWRPPIMVSICVEEHLEKFAMCNSMKSL